MSPTRTPLTGKLILFVLALILVCLVLLVIRAYQEPPRTSSAATAEESSVLGEPEAVDVFQEASKSTLSRSGSASTTNRIRWAPRQNTSVPPATPVSSPELERSNERAAGENQSTADFSTVNVGADITVPGAASGNGPAISGRVTLVGAPKPEVPIPMGPTCSRLRPEPVTTRHYVVSRDGGLANVLVWLKNAPRTRVPGSSPLLDQVGCMFEPYVLGVLVNQRFRIRNSDPELHNLHATPKLNPEFNFAQPLRGQITEKSFSKPELFIRIKCDVHPWMFAYISVLEHPYFAFSDTNGFFEIPAGFPSGDYLVGAVHLKTGEITEPVRVNDGEARTLQIQFDVTSPREPRGSVISMR